MNVHLFILLKSFHILKHIEFKGVILENIEWILTMMLDNVSVICIFNSPFRHKSDSNTIFDITGKLYANVY